MPRFCPQHTTCFSQRPDKPTASEPCPQDVIKTSQISVFLPPDKRTEEIDKEERTLEDARNRDV